MVGLRTARPRLNLSKSITVYDGSIEEKWIVNGYTDGFEPQNVKKNILDTGWHIPKLWNQGGYDAFQLTQDHLLRVVQVTRANSHPFKLCELLSAIHRTSGVYNIAYLDIIMVFPRNKDCPTCTSITGYLQLQQYNDHTSGISWQHSFFVFRYYKFY